MQMRRRDLLALFSLGPIASAEAQQTGRVYRIAFVSPANPLEAMTATGLPYYRALLDELRRLGYVEGQNTTVERYSGGGRTERYAELVGGVVRSQPDLIFTQTSHLVRRFEAATATIPIVAYMSDPVAEKLVSSLARPGGNITGLVADPGLSFYEKILELLGEALARRLSRVGMLTSSQRWGEAAMYSAYRIAAARVGVDFAAGVLRRYEEHYYRTAFDILKEEQIEAVPKRRTILGVALL